MSDERGRSRRAPSSFGVCRGKIFCILKAMSARRSGSQDRDTRRRQGSLHQSQLLLRPPDRRVCFAQRGSAVDGSPGGGAGRRGLHPAGGGERQTECRYSLKNSGFGGGAAISVSPLSWLSQEQWTCHPPKV